MSAQAVNRVCLDVLPTFPSGTVELVVLHPFSERQFEWADIPKPIKEHAEMRFHGPVDMNLYRTYGIEADAGALAVVRPDGYVGAVLSLPNPGGVDEYLSRCLVKI